jgi:CRP-like cAMP-binding protein
MNDFEIDTYRKAMDFYCALRLYRAKERLQFILSLYPELLELTHDKLAELTGLERETVTRTLKILRADERKDKVNVDINSSRIAGYNLA